MKFKGSSEIWTVYFWFSILFTEPLRYVTVYRELKSVLREKPSKFHGETYAVGSVQPFLSLLATATAKKSEFSRGTNCIIKMFHKIKGETHVATSSCGVGSPWETGQILDVGVSLVTLSVAR